MKTHDDKSGYILYIGNYLDEQVVKQRGLPTCNPAGSNRMRRIAEAIKSQGQPVAIISPAISLRVSWRGKIWHPSLLSRVGNVPVLFCGTVGVPFIGALLEPIFILIALQNFVSNHRVKSVILYNFNPTLVLVTLWIKLFWKVPIFNNIEDVSQPKLIDWLPKTEARPLQQIVFSVCMMAIIRLCQGVIIPANNFTIVIPSKIPFLNVSGCMPFDFKKINYLLNQQEKDTIRLLFAGKIESEHGVDYLIKTLDLIAQDKNLAPKFKIDICGKGSKSDLVTSFAKRADTLRIDYHGFVSNIDYQELLLKADICIALQNPNGRYGTSKTPSKVYEYLGNGKMVITTKVGDLGFLPSNIICLCDFDDEKSLYQQLDNIAKDPSLVEKKSEAAAQYARNNFAYEKVGRKLLEFVSN